VTAGEGEEDPLADLIDRIRRTAWKPGTSMTITPEKAAAILDRLT
jgi:hypothetical protein